jgi:hypothetical protein
MIIRRLNEHVRTHNWFAVAIDLVVVIVGVFIGLQASNWNTTRIEENRAHHYLRRIRRDLDADLANYQERIDFWGQVKNYGSTALVYADTGDTRGLTQWELLLAYFQASQLGEFYITESTYEELKSAGELGLIADINLRDSLAAYYTEAARDAVFTDRPDYRRRVRGIIPLEIQNYIWASCWTVNSSFQQTLKECPAPVTEAVSTNIVDSLRHNAALMSELRFWMSTMEVASKNAEASISNVKQLLETIDAVLITSP